MNSIEAGALGNPVLAGKSSPAPEFSTPNWKYSATAAQMRISHWALWAIMAGLGTGTKKLPGPKQFWVLLVQCWTWNGQENEKNIRWIQWLWLMCTLEDSQDRKKARRICTSLNHLSNRNKFLDSVVCNRFGLKKTLQMIIGCGTEWFPWTHGHPLLYGSKKLCQWLSSLTDGTDTDKFRTSAWECTLRLRKMWMALSQADLEPDLENSDLDSD